ncbi:hypothetical protein EDD11_006181 [Mortierella claussenii]|nr:hypothetical protein EDD11_006181 [Mortierella claussenii]
MDRKFEDAMHKMTYSVDSQTDESEVDDVEGEIAATVASGAASASDIFLDLSGVQKNVECKVE